MRTKRNNELMGNKMNQERTKPQKKDMKKMWHQAGTVQGEGYQNTCGISTK